MDLDTSSTSIGTSTGECKMSRNIQAEPQILQTNSHVSNSFRFLDLPREIRDMVYSESVHNNEIVYEPRVVLDHPVCFSTKPGQNAHGLLLASKQVSSEYQEHVYKHVHFKFRTITHKTVCFRHWRVSDNVLRRIRYCTFIRDLNMESFRSAWVSRHLFIPTLVRQLDNLQKLCVEIKLRPAMVLAELDPKDRTEKPPHVPEYMLTNIWGVPLEEYAYETGAEGYWEM